MKQAGVYSVLLEKVRCSEVGVGLLQVQRSYR